MLVDELDRPLSDEYQFVVVSKSYSDLLFLFSMEAEMSKRSFPLLYLIHTFSQNLNNIYPNYVYDRSVRSNHPPPDS